MPFAPLPKRKFSPTDTRSAPRRADQHLLDEVLGALLGEAAVEGDHHELPHPQLRDQVALDREGC